MRKLGLILLLCICCAMTVVSQNVAVLFDESDYIDNSKSDTVALDTVTTVCDSADNVLDTLPHTEDVVPAKVISAYSVHYRSDVRNIRDSLKHAMRIARGNMHKDIRDMRDSVRDDMRERVRQFPHQLRIGWGDQMFETLVWYHQTHPTIYPESYIGQYEEDFRYVQHWFAEYQYRVKYWFNVGAMVDYSGVLWDKVRRNGKGEELDREADCSFHNIAIMLTMHFTYFHSKHVSLYSGLGAGMNINTGSEVDYLDRHTAVAPALNITALGMNVGNNRWFGAVEFGGLYSLANINEVYMAGSRMFTVSVGCRFR